MLPLKIKEDKYGEAIALLLQMGGGFQTRFLRTLIVNSEQRHVLEKAGCVAINGRAPKSRKRRGERAE